MQVQGSIPQCHVAGKCSLPVAGSFADSSSEEIDPDSWNSTGSVSS